MLLTDIKRVWTLVVLLLLGLSGIWLLPKATDIKPTRLAKSLPDTLGNMRGEIVTISERELKILAKDTEFERKNFIDIENKYAPPIQASIVFSGKDLNNSIHRPERCLKAQGWNFTKERNLILEGVLPNGGDLPVRQIVCQKPRVDRETNKVVKLPNGQVFYDLQVQYYTFVGYKEITSSHYLRTWEDMKGRVFGGYDQSWAYVTFSTTVTQAYVDQGLTSAEFVGYNLDECEIHLTKFIEKLMPKMIDRQVR